MKKILSFLLALAMLLALIVTMVACQPAEQPGPDDKPSTDKPSTDKPSTNNPDPNEPGEDERIPVNYLPTTTYGGAQIHILEWSCNDVDEVGMSWIPWEEGDVEVEDGDMLASAVFDRNAWVEETYGV